MIKIKLLAAIAAVAWALPALGQAAAPSVDKSQANPAARTQQGAKTGQLTAKETAKPKKERKKRKQAAPAR